MALTVQSLSELDADAVEQEQEFATELLQEENPTLYLKRGVLHDLLLSLHAMLSTAIGENVDRLKRSMSLLNIEEDPTLSDDDVVDAVASNYLITRQEGTVATGYVTIVLDTLTSVTIASGASFEAQGLTFITEEAFSARVSNAELTSDTDRVLTPMGDGTYSFTIQVVAEEAGSAGRLRKDTVVVPDATIPYFVKAYVSEDFAGGLDTETNAALIARLRYGIAAKAFSGRTNMSAALRSQTEFANVVGDSIVGFGDIEMKRDAHGIFPGSGGGRVDWYVRTEKLSSSLSLTKTATLVEIEAETGYGIWQFSLGRDDAPGFYDVEAIRQTDDTSTSGTYEITEEVRGYDLTELDNDGFLPDIASAEEAAYSRFQTSVVKFRDIDTSVTGLTANSSTKDYAVTVRAMPLIADIQDYAAGRGTRNCAGDVLVKAPVPCYLSVSFTVELPPNSADIDEDAIKAALADTVNTFGFTGRLPAGKLADVIHNYLPDKAYVGAIDMFGKILRPDQTVRYIRSSAILSVPTEASQMVTGRTVAFILDPRDIAISTVTADIPEV